MSSVGDGDPISASWKNCPKPTRQTYAVDIPSSYWRVDPCFRPIENPSVLASCRNRGPKEEPLSDRSGWDWKLGAPISPSSEIKASRISEEKRGVLRRKPIGYRGDDPRKFGPCSPTPPPKTRTSYNLTPAKLDQNHIRVAAVLIWRSSYSIFFAVKRIRDVFVPLCLPRGCRHAK